VEDGTLPLECVYGVKRGKKGGVNGKRALLPNTVERREAAAVGLRMKKGCSSTAATPYMQACSVHVLPRLGANN